MRIVIICSIGLIAQAVLILINCRLLSLIKKNRADIEKTIEEDKKRVAFAKAHNQKQLYEFRLLLKKQRDQHGESWKD